MAGMGGGGTLGLVNDLSVKLQKQRKQCAPHLCTVLRRSGHRAPGPRT